jgi:alkylation response protein AidB-like acyl-CoA dehydrogenase
MDFALSEAQQDLSGLARQILADDRWPLPDHGTGGFDPKLWNDLATAGVLDAALPESVGGGGFGLLEQCSILIEIGRTLAQAPYLSTICAAGSTLARYGTSAQVEHWLLPALRGNTVLAAAIPDAAADPGLRAHRDGEGWRISGTHPTVPDGAFAAALLLVATTEDGPAVFVVDAGASGLTLRPQSVVDRADSALLEAEEVDAVLLGDESSAEFLSARMAIGGCATQLGVLDRALEMTADYARERTQFGKPIGSFQAVRQRLADRYGDVDAVRLTLWQAASALAEGEPAHAEIEVARYWAAEAGHLVAHAAVHIHGGVGIDTEHPLHRYFVAAKRAEFSGGGATAALRALGKVLAG